MNKDFKCDKNSFDPLNFETMFGIIDDDHDGALSKEEFIRLAKHILPCDKEI